MKMGPKVINTSRGTSRNSKKTHRCDTHNFSVLEFNQTIKHEEENYESALYGK